MSIFRRIERTLVVGVLIFAGCLDPEYVAETPALDAPHDPAPDAETDRGETSDGAGDGATVRDGGGDQTPDDADTSDRAEVITDALDGGEDGGHDVPDSSDLVADGPDGDDLGVDATDAADTADATDTADLLTDATDTDVTDIDLSHDPDLGSEDLSELDTADGDAPPITDKPPSVAGIFGGGGIMFPDESDLSGTIGSAVILIGQGFVGEGWSETSDESHNICWGQLPAATIE